MGGVAHLSHRPDPAGHGVFDILEHKPGREPAAAGVVASILAPIWPQRMTEAGRTTLLMNVPDVPRA